LGTRVGRPEPLLERRELRASGAVALHGRHEADAGPAVPLHLIDDAVRFAGAAFLQVGPVPRRAEHEGMHVADARHGDRLLLLLGIEVEHLRARALLDPLQGAARRLSSRSPLASPRSHVAVEAEQGVEPFGTLPCGHARHAVHLVGRSGDGFDGPLLVPAQLAGEVVARLLGPGLPDLADPQVLQDVPGLQEAGDMVPMLVGDDQEIEPVLGDLDDVLRDRTHAGLGVARSRQHAEVDKHVRARLAIDNPFGVGVPPAPTTFKLGSKRLSRIASQAEDGLVGDGLHTLAERCSAVKPDSEPHANNVDEALERHCRLDALPRGVVLGEQILDRRRDAFVGCAEILVGDVEALDIV
jgi:hypothetical protein